MRTFLVLAIVCTFLVAMAMAESENLKRSLHGEVENEIRVKRQFFGGGGFGRGGFGGGGFGRGGFGHHHGGYGGRGGYGGYGGRGGYGGYGGGYYG